MSNSPTETVSIGRYTGVINARYHSPELLSWLQDIRSHVSASMDKPAQRTRNINARVVFPASGKNLEFAVKSFGRQSVAKDWINTIRSSKARRTWLVASFLHEHGIGTPPPVGFLERLRAGCLLESYYLSEYQRDTTSFQNELIRLFREDPVCERFMNLLQCVADAIRKMHEAGVLHNDLGNQNIMLRRKDSSSWGSVQFVDLNRARIKGRLSLKDRARDISRIYLPSDLLRVFKEMYFGDTPPPAEFQKWEKFYRRRYAVHSRTRKYRHPIRTFLNREAERKKIKYPSEQDMWIWDEKSAQPISVMRPEDRVRFRQSSSVSKIGWTAFKGAPRIRREYGLLLKNCYCAPVAMSNRIGLAISPTPATLDREIKLMQAIGTIPVLIRFCYHESDERHRFLADVVKDLHTQRHAVSIALVQNREAVLEPSRWESFMEKVLYQTAGHTEYVEVGHAINRVKWGIWNLDEHRRLMEAVLRAKEKYPAVSFTGPAVIDFEYPFLMAALKNVPGSLRFAALSHHLYVDRRGAPENRQGGFSALEKFALAHAIARWSGVCDDKLIISEVNWPLKGTGVYSPVTSPYESPGPRHGDPSVSEAEYGDYMLRYLAIAICSGMVDRVYWWRLVARGFGLVDDTDPVQWRERPAYRMLKHFVALLSSATFVEKSAMAQGQHLFMFSLPDGDKIYLAYSEHGEQQVELPFECTHIVDAEGHDIACTGRSIRISDHPIYVFAE